MSLYKYPHMIHKYVRKYLFFITEKYERLSTDRKLY